jgi:hypothetical protein
MPYIDLNALGLSPANSGEANRLIIQNALDRGGTVAVTEPGIYDIDSSLMIGSYTTLEFANGAALRKTSEREGFAHVLINKGAFNKTWDEHIVVRGMKVIVNNVAGKTPIGGLRGQLAFHYVRDLRLDDIRIPDLEPSNFGIHVCTFEDINITNCIITGKKDGIHLGRGRRFYIGNCVFDTYDDAVALNAHDYDTSNPELGCIEDGVVEKCYDINPEKAVGYFCRILAGAWVDWYEGMEVQKSDSVISNGRLYRVFAKPDGTKYISKTRPSHESGHMILDGIDWHMVQDDLVYEAGVRNVTFRDIFLYKPRTAFSIHFDHDVWSRSFYPGAKNPLQEQIVFDNVRVLHNGGNDFLSVVTPIDSLTLTNCSLRNNKIRFANPVNLENIGDTKLTFTGCSTSVGDISALVQNNVPGKRINLTVDGKSVTI